VGCLRFSIGSFTDSAASHSAPSRTWDWCARGPSTASGCSRRFWMPSSSCGTRSAGNCNAYAHMLPIERHSRADRGGRAGQAAACRARWGAGHPDKPDAPGAAGGHPRPVRGPAVRAACSGHVLGNRHPGGSHQAVRPLTLE
jgi:hypothetical protein